MKKYVKILILIICILSLVRLSFTIIFDKNVYKEENRVIIAKVCNVEKNKDKIVIDIRKKEGYRLTLYDEINVEEGDVIKVTGPIITPPDNTIFGLFNYRKYLLSKKINYIVKPNNVKVKSKNKNILYKLKNNMSKKIEDYKSKAYLKAFLMGDTTLIDKKIKSNYQLIGISHLLSISGMHVNLLLLIINFMLKKFKYRNTIIFIFLLFFLFITGFPISLIRVCLFLSLNYLNKLLKLNIKPVFVIIITALLLLLYNPYLVYNVGFLFSVIITFFLILCSEKLRKVKGYFKCSLKVSIVSFLASIPLLAYYFFKLNFLTPIYNLVFVPFVSFILFPLCIITFFIPFLDKVLFFFISILECLSSLFSSINIFTFVISKPNIIIVILYYILLYLTLRFNYKYLIIYFIILFININSRFMILNPEVTFLDVGQGDSIVFILPMGKVVMLDTGGNMQSTCISFKKIIPYLNSRGINKIEWLILTHGDYDHMGESITLVNNFNVENVCFNVGDYNDLEINLIKVLEKKNIPYYQNIEKLNIGDIKLYFLNTKNYDNENDNSNVIYTSINNVKLLFMGDAGKTKEKDLISEYNLHDIDILKVGHHGSNTSSSEEFIENIVPRTCLISVGKNNRYGHPKENVLDILHDCDIYRTDLNGSLKIKLKNNKYSIKTISPYRR